MGKTAWALLWPVRCVLVAAVPWGISSWMLGLEQDTWRENEHGPTIVIVLAYLFFCLGKLVVYAFVRVRWMDERTSTARWVVFWAGAAVVVISSFAAGGFGARDAEQRILHDRGVTAAGVVTGIRTHTGDSGAPRQDGVYVRLDDGRSLSVDGEPRVGSTVQVTADPLGKVGPRLGRRPAPPTGQLLEVFLVVLAVGHVMEASLVCGPLTRKAPGTTG
ncbi:hypothetical protein [Kitasatospora cineracea]|uniref:hypothetical protein n=1 Tax=Kitasatospora cineracea TaxID=88074 RepID=UPI003787F242